jgi:hypothetical protein
MITNFSQVAHFYNKGFIQVKTTFNCGGYNDYDYNHLDSELLDLLNDGTDLVVKPFLKHLKDITQNELDEMNLSCKNEISNAIHSSLCYSACQTSWLTEKGYDAFQLIENGIAFDVAQHCT